MEDSRSASGGNAPAGKDDAVLKKMSDQEIEDVLKKADEQLKKPGGGSGRKSTADRKADSKNGGSSDRRSEKNSQEAAGGKETGQRGSSLTDRKENRQAAVGRKETGAVGNPLSAKKVDRERVVEPGAKSGNQNGNGLSDRKSEREGQDASGAIRTEGWQEPLDMSKRRKRIEPGAKITIGWIFADVMEGIWILFKLAVVVSLVTVIVGFFLTRDLCIRGRNGERLCVDTLQSTSLTAANRSDAEDKTKQWLKKAKREKLTLVADDKSILVARAIRTKKESDKWAVVLHGYNGNMEDVYDIAMRYQENGYNVLTPDLRANGESEGMFLGMGWTDRLDIINWIDVILQENPSAKVVIHGIDVGADAALMLSGESLKSSIKAIIADGAYTNAWDVVKKEYQVRHEKLPAFPFMYTMNPVMKVWAGFTLKDADAVSQVKCATVPILLIRGENDTYASEDMTQELNEAIASRHEVLNITGAGHADCRFAEPETYYGKVFDFAGFYMD